ncbi:hypothetical protein LIER_15017 [Lithospermum erythrorhizon]|uniref:Nucleolar protein 16 n=1 Tax=Lithospermum erythrorhizon TaxID=34254 RepID=A0AAV3Q2S2_LITER
MGGSRRKYKRSKPKVRVGLPKKNPNIIKPSFNLPPKLRALINPTAKWDDEGSVLENYKAFGVVSDPNVRCRKPNMVEEGSLNVPPSQDEEEVDEFQPIDSGSDLEEDDLKSALGKRRRDGENALPQPLTATQRIHIRRLVEKYGDDYQRMFKDIKLNSMQHSVATLQKLCHRYNIYKDKNPLIVGNQ